MCPEEMNDKITNANTGESADPALYSDDRTKIIRFPIESDVTDYTIREFVSQIGSSAFGGCIHLRNIHIPANITEIGELAFSCCDALEGFDVSSDNPFYKSVDGVLYNKEMTRLIACPKGSNPITFTVPDSVTEIGDWAFSGCDTLQSIVIPEGVARLGNRALSGCSSLQSIKIPASVEVIGELAFWRCTSLTNIVIPDTVKVLGDGAFSNCTGLTDISLSRGLSLLDARVFTYCTALKEISLPDNITSIGDKAFAECTALETISVPASVTSFGLLAFHNCSALREMNYLGTEEQFEGIGLLDGNDALFEAEIRFCE